MTGEPDDRKLEHCPALVAIGVISGKWKTRILWQLRSGPIHFGELRRKLKGVSPKMLTEHLRQLEADGLIRRETETAGRTSMSVYRFTDYGLTLVPALDRLGEWGAAHERRGSV